MTILSWSSCGTTTVEVRSGAPDGPLLSRGGPSGTASTANWVHHGHVFYLQDASDGPGLTAADTLATVILRASFVGSGEAHLFPDLAPFSAHLARRYGCTRILVIGPGVAAGFRPFHFEFEIVVLASGQELERARREEDFAIWIDWSHGNQAALPLSPSELGHTLVVCAGVIERLEDPLPLLRSIAGWLRNAPCAVVTLPLGDGGFGDYGGDEARYVELEALLRIAGLRPAFTGSTARDDEDQQGEARLAVIEGSASCSTAVDVPPLFRATAIVCAYNEADLIVRSIERLNEDGVGVYLIDNWSDDGTYELALPLLGKGLIGVERYPVDGPVRHSSWKEILDRKDEVAQSLDADWLLHTDVDEIRTSPWRGVSLREALYRVDRSGFNCVDFTVLHFYPLDESFAAGLDFEDHFTHFEFATSPPNFHQIKAWKKMGRPADLASSGGHEASFSGRRVFPYKFLLKHYPIRSQAHGQRKVLAERRARWRPEEIARGWHSQYADIGSDHVFIKSPATMEVFDETDFQRRFMLERLSGVGVLRRRLARERAHSDAGPEAGELRGTTALRGSIER